MIIANDTIRRAQMSTELNIGRIVDDFTEISKELLRNLVVYEHESTEVPLGSCIR